MATFALLSLNCFGVPTPTVRGRLRTLAQALNSRDATIVCLQEVQTHGYRQLLTCACTAYSYQAYYPFVHAPKGGLLTLGRVPLIAPKFTLYKERGIWYTPGIMDWILHKGMLCTTAFVHELPVIVINTHLNANYHGNWSRTNIFARGEWQQLQQLATCVAALPTEALIIVAGDFNIPRGSWLYDDFLTASGLTDPLAGDMRPTYRNIPGLPARFALPIDFIFFRAPALNDLHVQANLVFDARQPLINGGSSYLSDHLGLEFRCTWDAS